MAKTVLPVIAILLVGWLHTGTAAGEAMAGEVEIVGLWSFDDDTADRTGSWSGFGSSAHGGITLDEQRVGIGAYSAVHGPETRTNWRHHATGRIILANEAAIDGATAFGMALWARPVKVWTSRGRIISFGPEAFGIGNVPGDREGQFRLANADFVDAEALAPFTLPMDEWTHIAVTADGETVRLLINGEVISEAAQTGPLNGGEQLYLGAIGSGGVGLLSTYIDELVFVRGPADAAWAQSIYEATRSGEPLPYEMPPPPPFEPVERDTSKYLRLSVDDIELTAGTLERIDFTATETPLFGVYIPQRMLRDEAVTREVIEDLEAHHCNTIIVRLGWCIERASLLQLFHEHNFRVFVIVAPPYGADLVREHADVARRNQEGDTLDTASFYDERYIEYLRETWLAEGLKGRGIDGLILDEPAMRDYRIALREGKLYHAHPAEQAAYRRMHGGPYPSDLDLTEHRGTQDYERVMAFRRRMVSEWLQLVEEVVHSRGPNVQYHIVVTPDVVSNYRHSGGFLRASEAAAVDVEALLRSDGLHGIQMTAYLNAWGGHSPAWAQQFLPLFKDKAHEHGKASIFWAQAYLESQRHVERGIQPGNVGQLIDYTVGEGVDGMFVWSYRGFSQDDYNWDDYFEEFSEAAARHVDRPAEGLKVEVVDDNANAARRVRELGAGEYQLQISFPEPGTYTLRVRNRLGFEQLIPVQVHARQE
ncbi:LamG-like jellyroll fold domain-containing protein [Phycisphaerales bacterium AB-hyl4]|uniref:LamG-like jellyroll fold domain-containing protein n=1 Tax=Natronomicrosphaera hydrolytica TaxID=3242702 RepID=A0ABV4U840_9BACT